MTDPSSTLASHRPAAAERHAERDEAPRSGVRVVTLGCRLNAYESEVMRRHAAAAGPRRRRHRQHLRRHRRGRAPGRARPSASSGARTRPRASSSPAAPRRSSPSASPPCPRSITSSATPRRCDAETFRGLGLADSPRVAGQRHHVGARDGARPDRRLRLARARLRAGAERLRPPLHLLHHPLRPRAVALGAGGRGGGAGAPAGRGRLRRGRAHRRRHHRLRRRPAGRHDARASWCATILRHVPELQRLRLSSIDQVEADAHLHATPSPRSRG